MERAKQIIPPSLLTLTVNEIVSSISDRVLGDIPEGIGSVEDMHMLEMLLGRLPNDYAYVVSLLGHSRTYVRQLKRNGHKQEYEDMMDKRDALENIASALKMKYQGVSRMVTTFELGDNETKMHEFRKEKEQKWGR